MLLSPLFIDIRAGAVSGLGELLSDRRISADAHVAVAVGPGQGEALVKELGPELENADLFTVRAGSLDAAGELQAALRGKHYDALVGIGGGRTLDGNGLMRRITKLMAPSEANGEYIGATLIKPEAADALAVALEATWRRDPDLYYEDGYQTLVDTGGEVGVAPIGSLPWVEVDNHADLTRAREIACHY
jgi:hypothetical protein